MALVRLSSNRQWHIMTSFFGSVLTTGCSFHDVKLRNFRLFRQRLAVGTQKSSATSSLSLTGPEDRVGTGCPGHVMGQCARAIV